MNDTSSRAASRSAYLLPAVALGLGIILAALVFGLFFQTSRARVDTIQVTGAATEAFTSDIAKWRITLTRQVPDVQMATGYAMLRQDVESFSSRLEAAGISRGEISVQPVSSQPYWGREGVREGYNLNQSLYVLSHAPEVLEDLARDPGTLLGEGSVLESSMLEYYYSGIDSLKHSLLAAATRDARARALEIANADGQSALLLVALTAASSRAAAQSWSNARPRPALFQIVAIDRTGELGFPYEREDIAGDGLGTFAADEAATGKYHRMNQFPVLWDAPSGMIFFGGSSSTPCGLFADLMTQAFEMELDRVSVGYLATQWADRHGAAAARRPGCRDATRPAGRRSAPPRGR